MLLSLVCRVLENRISLHIFYRKPLHHGISLALCGLALLTSLDILLCLCIIAIILTTLCWLLAESDAFRYVSSSCQYQSSDCMAVKTASEMPYCRLYRETGIRTFTAGPVGLVHDHTSLLLITDFQTIRIWIYNM